MVKKVAIVPTSKYYENNRIFNNKFNKNRLLDPYIHFFNHSSSQLEINTIDFVDKIKELDVIVFERIDFKYLILSLLLNKNSLRILIPWEPEVVIKFHNTRYLRKIAYYFDYVLTWNDQLVDNKNFYKLHFPVNLAEPNFLIPTVIDFKKKKLMTQISSNLVSSHPLELYSKRKFLNIEISKLLGNGFEFFGTRWDKLKLSTYKGVTNDKFLTLGNYKYSLCLENMNETEGYITEKIFDCFKSSVVPIYLGASNINSYVPKDCYIDLNDYSSAADLIDSLNTISYKSWLNYIENAKRFLDSNESNLFNVPSFSNRLTEIIHKPKNNKKNIDSYLVALAIHHSIYTLLQRIFRKARFRK